MDDVLLLISLKPYFACEIPIIYTVSTAISPGLGLSPGQVCPGFCRFLQYRTLASKRDDRRRCVAGVYLGMDFNDGQIYGLYNGKLQSLKLLMGKYGISFVFP